MTDHDPLLVKECLADITLVITTTDGRTEVRHVLVAVSELRTFLTSGQNMMYLQGKVLPTPREHPTHVAETN